MLFSDVLITLDNAVKNNTPAMKLADAIDLMDTDILYTRMNWNDSEVLSRLKRVERYELLIPNMIPPAYIR